MASPSGTADDAALAAATADGGGSAAAALAWRAFRDSRARTITFAAIFLIYAYIQPVGYRQDYPTRAQRLAFARSFGSNKAIRLFYGDPHNLLSVSGYSAWRVGGTLAILTAVFGLLAAVRALRTEEDSGRMELVLAAPLGRRLIYRSALSAMVAGAAILWLAEFLGFQAGGLPAGGSAFLALATVSVLPVCVGVGALACQIASSRRVALELGGAIVGLLFMLRVVADTSTGLGWLRWTTPLGWAEEMRPFAGPQPLVLLLPLVATLALLALAARIAAVRDVGTGLLPARDSARPSLRLLRGPTAQALRGERGALLSWSGAVAVFALILGVVAKSVSSAGISKPVQREIAKLGSGSIATPTGYLAFVFIFFVLAVSVFSCAQVAAARHEEAEQRLETLLALPVGRVGWLAGRLGLAGAGAVAISLAAGLFSWAGAASQGVGESLPKMLEAGANCMPVALLFLGVAALAYAVAPRASAGVAYALVAVAFLWQLVGALAGVPHWLVEATPFAHVGLVPTQPFRLGAAAVMVAIGVAAALVALGVFRRRDLVGV